jgi:hypothetical protein
LVEVVGVAAVEWAVTVAVEHGAGVEEHDGAAVEEEHDGVVEEGEHDDGAVEEHVGVVVEGEHDGAAVEEEHDGVVEEHVGVVVVLENRDSVGNMGLEGNMGWGDSRGSPSLEG